MRQYRIEPVRSEVISTVLAIVLLYAFKGIGFWLVVNTMGMS